LFFSPKYSKKHVSRAGSVLVEGGASSDERSHAFGVLNHWRTCHAYPINTFQATLRSRLLKVCRSALVAQRLKRTPSIIKKLQLNPGMQLARMQDIGGLRAVVETVQQIRELESLFKKSRSSHELVREDDYISTPKDSGYRSLHLVCRYKSTSSPEYNGLCIELQIRTKLQHAWATAVETIGTFLDQA
jgi:putative GTP pyrophosphokinase